MFITRHSMDTERWDEQ